MKKTLFLSAAILMAMILPGKISAQLVLPQPSPKASVMQAVGLTDITIDYSCPGVKGRTIWGELVPYDQLWRTGANSATKITFSKDVKIGETAVPKGSYSIFTIPGKTSWTFILNKNATASADEYKKEEDLLRMTVTPEAIPMRERMAFIFSDFSDDNVKINLEWEKVRITIPVATGTSEQAMANIKNSTESTWRIYNSAARYMMDTKKDYDAGLKYVDQSLLLGNEWYNNWTKAQLLAAKNNYKEAVEYAKKAKELGDKNVDGFFFKPQVEKALIDWPAKVK
ncbi:MAG TPA: DUF2911 domain-containing protein [Bacteroidia bacterium]|nr:DUF2911 domain-containing protein [Bacteroidia bacterium]